LVEYLATNPSPECEVLTAFPDETYRNVRIEDVLAVSSNAGWITVQGDGVLTVTDSGQELVNTRNAELRMRMQVERLIDVMQPDWAAMAVQGRSSLLGYTDANVRQCFKEAGLAAGNSKEVVAWWDRLASRFRGVKDFQYTKIGREGERLSYVREYSRTGVEPSWIALEHADAGYDLVSRASTEDSSPLLVEVKATTQSWNNASFFMSRHEWDILSAHGSAVLHLWGIKDVPAKHAAVSIPELEDHVPLDSGSGQWRKFSCPFRNFEPLQVEIEIAQG
jgi:hypothetical protein